MKATSRAEAWQMANEIFPTDYMKDEGASSRAGYDIYRNGGGWCLHPIENYNQWISDLGNRLEINLDNGKTINIWIEIPKPGFSEAEIGTALEVISDIVSDIDDLVTSKMQEATGLGEARKKAYESYKVLAEMLKKDYPNSYLYQQYNLKDA